MEHMPAIIKLVTVAVGAVVYGVSANGKAMELGRLAFACGLLATMLGLR